MTIFSTILSVAVLYFIAHMIFTIRKSRKSYTEQKNRLRSHESMKKFKEWVEKEVKENVN